MTEYDKIYSKFLANISDYDFLLMEQPDIDQLLLELLDSAVAEFEICKSDLSDRDDKKLQFNVELTPQEIEILALGMTCHWLRPKVMNTDNLRNALNTKDYTTFSPAKLLEQMIALQKQMDDKLSSRIILYSYRRGNISSLTS